MSTAGAAVTAALDGFSIFLISDHASDNQRHYQNQYHQNNERSHLCTTSFLLSEARILKHQLQASFSGMIPDFTCLHFTYLDFTRFLVSTLKVSLSL